MSSSTISKLAVGGPTSRKVQEGQYKGVDHAELAESLIARVETTPGVSGRVAAIKLITTYVAILASGGLKKKNFKIENYSQEAQAAYAVMNPIVTAAGWSQSLSHFVQAYPVISAMTSSMKPNNVKVEGLPNFLANTQGASLIPASERFRELLLFGCQLWSARFSMMTNGKLMPDANAEAKLAMVNSSDPSLEAFQSAVSYGMQSFSGTVLSEAERILFFNSLVAKEYGSWANYEAAMDNLSASILGPFAPVPEAAAGNGQAALPNIRADSFLPKSMQNQAVKNAFDGLFPGLSLTLPAHLPTIADWDQSDLDFLKEREILTTINGVCGPTGALAAGIFPQGVVTVADPMVQPGVPNGFINWPPAAPDIVRLLNMDFGQRVDGFLLNTPQGQRRAPALSPLNSAPFVQRLQPLSVLTITYQAEKEKAMANAKVQLELAKAKSAIVSRLIAGQKPAAGLSVDHNGDLIADLQAVLATANATEDAQKIELLARTAKAELDAREAKERWLAAHPGQAPQFMAVFNQ